MSLETEVFLVIAALGVISLALGCAVVVLFRQRRMLLEANRRSDVRYRTVLDQVADSIFLVDAETGRLIDANSAFRRTQGSGAEIGQLTVEDILIETPVDHDTAAFARLTHSHPRTIKQRCTHGQIDVEVTVSHVQIDGRPTLCYIARDVTARKNIELELLRNQRHLDHLAHHDPLTGLPNRLFLRSYLEQALEACSAGGGLAVMLLDLDNLKSINDSSGHNVGDEVLVEFARQLEKFVASRGGIVGRLGGDEFVLVLRNVAGRAAAVTEASTILKMFTAPLRVGGRLISTSVSIGVTLCPQDAHDLGTVLRNADLAMYQAKASGRGNAQFFEPDITNVQHRPQAGPLSHRSRNG